MSKDRSVATDALEVLGLPDLGGKTVERDAIHLAVEPAVAGMPLEAGENIIRNDEDGKWYRCPFNARLAIVDPFLRDVVPPDGRFLAVVPPREITSLRHVWSHPKFPDAIPVAPAYAPGTSEAWMMTWARRHVSEDYYGDEGRVSDEKAYAFALKAGEEHYIGPYEDARDYIDDEWWNHWEAITGKRGNRGAYFSCGC